VLAPLRWWVEHPWAVFWLTIFPTSIVMTNFELFLPPSRFARGFIIFTTVVLAVSFAQGLRVSWQRSRVRALLFAACLALYSVSPLLMPLGGGNVSLYQLPQTIGLFVLIIGGAVGLEYAARTPALREILQVPTAVRRQSESTQVDAGTVAAGRARRVWRRVGLVAGILLALVVGLVVYPGWKIGAARSRAETLCAAAVVGGPVTRLHAKAEDLGLAVWSSPARTEPDGKLRPASITGWSGWMYARWFCTIEHGDGKVLGKRTYFLD
jgi:hypothetical protein